MRDVWRRTAVMLWKQDSLLVRGSSRSAICLSQDDRLVKAVLGCPNPAAANESRRLENATEFLPPNGTIVRDVMLSLRSALDFPRYIKMQGIMTLIAPIPHLMNDATLPWSQ